MGEKLPLLSRSPLTIREETMERFSCHYIQTQTHTRSHTLRIHTRTLTHRTSCDSTRKLHASFPPPTNSPGQLPLILSVMSTLITSSQRSHCHLCSDRPQQWRHGVKQNLKNKSKPLQHGVPLVFVHCQSPEIQLCQHAGIFTLLPNRKS